MNINLKYLILFSSHFVVFPVGYYYFSKGILATPVIVLAVYCLLFLADVIVVGVYLKNSNFQSAFAYAFFIALLVALPIISTNMAASAFNSCVDRSEALRLAIVQHQVTTGQWPKSLKDMDPQLICGQRAFLGTLLMYQPSENDFVLSFQDSLVTFQGTSTEPMTARK